VSIKKTVAILDFGSQYTQLITRRVREHHVYSEIFPFTVSPEELQEQGVEAIILSGGPANVYKKNAPTLNQNLLNINIPILGICYGLHLLVNTTGGTIVSSGSGEYGNARINRTGGQSQLFNDIPENTQVWMSHGDEINELGPEWKPIAISSNGVVAAIQHISRPFFGVQFHPEVIHTTDGATFISNFLFNVCGCRPNWTPSNFINNAVKEITEKVGDNELVCGLSGGVDSSVVATLLHKAIGTRSHCIFIDHGMLRKEEVNQVMGSLRTGLGLNIHHFDHSKNFLQKLNNVIDPEKKRKIIGNEFIHSFSEIAKNIGNIHYLAQGTLYPDIIESGGNTVGPAVKIKSHHNVGGLPDDMPFDLIEPLKELFKDEVRLVGRELGLPEFVLNRHPFPGPGLAVRIIGKITIERLEILQNADHIFIDILKDTGEYDKIWQAFAVLIPIKTVGVMGDTRTYENLIALRAVTSTDGMTAEWYHLPYDVLDKCSNRIVNEVSGINRVVYDITGKPPGTIEWE
jgi:GMP synthase (glutamine-hydrolysing)